MYMYANGHVEICEKNCLLVDFSSMTMCILQVSIWIIIIFTVTINILFDSATYSKPLFTYVHAPHRHIIAYII